MKGTPVALITGASRGIGRAIAVELADQGYHIAALARRLETVGERPGLRELGELISRKGAQCLTLEGDVADLEGHAALVDSILNRWGRIDVLINNAGIAPRHRTDILEMDPASFDEVLDVNLRGPFFLSQRVAVRMACDTRRLNEYHPVMIFIGSISAEVSSLNRMEYCVSKAGLSMTARGFAHRLAETGVLVYEIRPGIIATHMTAPVKEKYDRLLAEGLAPQKRWGEPADVARCVSALVRGDLAYGTGSVIELSGGMQIRRL